MALHLPESLISALKGAQSITVLTGAGISAESGVPTFRDAQAGLWSRYDPQALATAEGFAANPKLVWEWYAWRRKLVAKAEPNRGHLALVQLQDRYPTCTLITQNVDGLHQRAGSRNVIELHGNITRTRCFIEGIPVTEWNEEKTIPPRCKHCGAWLRPDVVWFGEELPRGALAAQSCDVFFSIGTSAQVYPAAGLADLAKASGAIVVEINPDETPLTPLAHYSLRGAAGNILPRIISAIG
jgi:NAD-dependent deacetylase